MFVLTKQMLMHLKTAQNFKTNVCRLEKMFVDSKVFHVLDLGSFWKVLLCLGARSSFSHTRPPSHIRVHGRPVGRDAPIFFLFFSHFCFCFFFFKLIQDFQQIQILESCEFWKKTRNHKFFMISKNSLHIIKKFMIFQKIEK